jgi:hypothetical protein
MKRKVLTLDNNGVKEDLIPYVDDLAVVTGGSNLKEELEKIKSSIQKNNLFLGAFSSEQTLLASHPNGSELNQGTYAIVTDEDVIYLYDVETLSWKKTATSGLSILEINGLTPINGSLTITGGDIKSTVPNAEIEEQTITNHLNDLYSETSKIDDISSMTIAVGQGYANTTIENNSIVFNRTFYYKNSNTLYMTLQYPSGIKTTDYNKYTNVKLNYNDGTSKLVYLYSADNEYLTYKDLMLFLGLSQYNTEVDILLKIRNDKAVVINMYKKGPARMMSNTYYLRQTGWVDNIEGSGYQYIITAEESAQSNSYVVLNVYKEKNGVKTTAIVDYSINGNTVTLYSDEKFDGGITIQFTAG